MINLVPPQYKTAIHYARLNVSVVQYVIVALSAAALLGTVLFTATSLINNEKTNLEKQISQREDQVAALEPFHNEAVALSTKINTVSTILTKEVKFSEYIPTVAAALPEGAVLTGLSLTDELAESLAIDALVVNEQSAAVLQENLAASNLFTGADIISLTANQTGTGTAQDQYAFRVSISAFFPIIPVTTAEPAETEVEGPN